MLMVITTVLTRCINCANTIFLKQCDFSNTIFVLLIISLKSAETDSILGMAVIAPLLYLSGGVKVPLFRQNANNVANSINTST